MAAGLAGCLAEILQFQQLGRFQKLRDAGYATTLGQTYPTQGRYAEALVATGGEPSLVDNATPAVVFKPVGPAMAGPKTKGKAKTGGASAAVIAG